MQKNLIDSDLKYTILDKNKISIVLFGIDVKWYYTICPDGTNSNDNGGTCENNIIEPEHIRWD